MLASNTHHTRLRFPIEFFMMPDPSNITTRNDFDKPEMHPDSLRIARILLPTDLTPRSDRALDYGVKMARQFGATIILLHVVEPTNAVQGARFTSPAMEESNRAAIDAAHDALAQLCDKCRAPGIAVETLVRVGRAYSEIADTANALACDLIVMGTRKAARNASVPGSNTDWVVHHASCPVLTIH